MDYSRYTDRLVPTWSVIQGTERTGYEVANLGDLDPSHPLWIEENTLVVAGDLGASFEIQAIVLANHTYAEGTDVRFKCAASPLGGSPAPTTTVDLAIPIPADYRNGFSCNAWVDVAAVLTLSNRTTRYFSIGNESDPNDRTVSIGEIWIAGVFRPLSPEDVGHDYTEPGGQIVSRQASKKGVQTVYDTGSRSRGLTAKCRTVLVGRDAVLDWRDDSHGSARPMVIVLDRESTNRRNAEPKLVRFLDVAITPVSLMHEVVYDLVLNFDELGFGEPVNA